MEMMTKAAALAIVAAVLVLVVRRGSPETGLLLTLMACVLLAVLLAQVLQPILALLEQLRQTAGLNETVLAPLFKTVAIGLITRLASAVCSDAGLGSIAGFTELCGAACALYTALPLMNAVLELLQELMGG